MQEKRKDVDFYHSTDTCKSRSQHDQVGIGRPFASAGAEVRKDSVSSWDFAGTWPAARLLQPNMCLPAVGLENPMVDPFVQLNMKHSSVELSW